MTSAHKLFGAYDIRGIYGEGLDETFAKKVGYAFGQYIGPKGDQKILLGYDARLSSPSLAQAFLEGLKATGNTIINVGVTSTPMAVWYAAHHDFAGCAVVTASHLAAKHNGFKLYARKAQPLGLNNGLGEIKTFVESQSVPENSLSQGAVEGHEIVGTYIQYLLSHVNTVRPLKVAVDAGHGAAGPELEALKKVLAGKVELKTLNTVPDGNFPTRTPNPLDKGSLDALSALVRAEGCHFGVSFDGDADRAIFVDEQGNLVDTDLMIGLVGAEFVRKNGGGKVVYDLRASRAVPEYIAASGGEAVKTGVGTQFMMGGIRDNGAIFAGELSGHYYYADMYGTDNAMRTMIEIMNVVSVRADSFSEMMKPLTKYSTSGEINLRVASIQDTLRRLEASIAGGSKEHIDGLSVNFDDWWFSARGSQTEPVLRLTIGATSRPVLDQRKDQLIKIIEPAR